MKINIPEELYTIEVMNVISSPIDKEYTSLVAATDTDDLKKALMIMAASERYPKKQSIIRRELKTRSLGSGGGFYTEKWKNWFIKEWTGVMKAAQERKDSSCKLATKY